MAHLIGSIPFKGSIGGLSAYTRSDIDKIIIRTKGGASKEQIKKKPSFAATRKINQEWKGVTMMSKNIRENIVAVKHLADYNFTGTLNARCKKMQYADIQNENGKRSVLLSATRYLLDEFSLNKRMAFDAVLNQPLGCLIQRNENKVLIDIAPIYPSINFVNPGKYPFYRFVFMLGYVSDLLYNSTQERYIAQAIDMPHAMDKRTEWVSVQKKLQQQQVLLESNGTLILNDAITIIVSAGIEFGLPAIDGTIEYVKYSGCGKLLKLG